MNTSVRGHIGLSTRAHQYVGISARGYMGLTPGRGWGGGRGRRKKDYTTLSSPERVCIEMGDRVSYSSTSVVGRGGGGAES